MGRKGTLEIAEPETVGYRLSFGAFGSRERMMLAPSALVCFIS